MFQLVDDALQNAVIKVIGMGGGGGNAVDHMVNQDIEGVSFIIDRLQVARLVDIRLDEKTVGGEPWIP